MFSDSQYSNILKCIHCIVCYIWNLSTFIHPSWRSYMLDGNNGNQSLPEYEYIFPWPQGATYTQLPDNLFVNSGNSWTLISTLSALPTPDECLDTIRYITNTSNKLKPNPAPHFLPASPLLLFLCNGNTVLPIAQFKTRLCLHYSTPNLSASGMVHYQEILLTPVPGCMPFTYGKLWPITSASTSALVTLNQLFVGQTVILLKGI